MHSSLDPEFSDLFPEIDDPPMSLWSCLLYIAANIAAMLLFWTYQQSRQRRLQREQCSYVESNGSIRQPKRVFSQPSLLASLGFGRTKRSFFAFEDHFYSFEEVSRACRKAGLEKCALMIGVDFSASNEWQGRKSFAGQNLHKIVPGKVLNPYQKVISIMGKTLEPFDEDNLIPAYGFGDSVTGGLSVFPFNPDEKSCMGFSEVLDRYGDIATKITLGGPTNFAPIIHKAVDIVKRLKKYHILIIIADGQVTEQTKTVEAIVTASNYPLSIVVVGVGDGPWDVMDDFDNCLPERTFDNFQFVNFHGVTGKSRNPEPRFALHAMMEIPDQYKTIKSLGFLDEGENGKKDS